MRAQGWWGGGGGGSGGRAVPVPPALFLLLLLGLLHPHPRGSLVAAALCVSPCLQAGAQPLCAVFSTLRRGRSRLSIGQAPRCREPVLSRDSAGQPAMQGKESPTMRLLPWNHGGISPTLTFTDPQTRGCAHSRGQAAGTGAGMSRRAEHPAGSPGGRPSRKVSTGDGPAAGGKGQVGGSHLENGDDLSVPTTHRPTSAVQQVPEGWQ